MSPPSLRVSSAVLWRIALLISIVLVVNLLAAEAVEHIEIGLGPGNEQLIDRMILFSAVLYAGLIAIPFVPGVEVGLALIAMLGTSVVLLVYSCTVIGLTLSFLIGRLLPLSVMLKALAWLRLRRTERLLRRIEPLDGDERLRFLLNKAPGATLPFLLRHRYVALAVAINLPGNFLIGGGGGIALVAGLSRLFSVSGFLITIAVAVAPVPLLIAFFGKDILG